MRMKLHCFWLSILCIFSQGLESQRLQHSSCSTAWSRTKETLQVHTEPSYHPRMGLDSWTSLLGGGEPITTNTKREAELPSNKKDTKACWVYHIRRLMRFYLIISQYLTYEEIQMISLYFMNKKAKICHKKWTEPTQMGKRTPIITIPKVFYYRKIPQKEINKHNKSTDYIVSQHLPLSKHIFWDPKVFDGFFVFCSNKPFSWHVYVLERYILLFTKTNMLIKQKPHQILL